MKYDFDTVTDRKNTNSLKWDVAENELPMWVADMDFRTAPEIISAIEKRVQNGIFGYSIIPNEWYDAYINWWKKRHGITFDKEELVFSAGVIPTLSSSVRRLTAPNENVLVLTPVYNMFYNSIKNNGRNVLKCPLDYIDGEYKINWERLESCLSQPQTSLMFMCNPQNPVGKIWDKGTLARIGELAYKSNVVVISDEIHCDLTDPNCTYVPFASASDICRENSITCIAPTKAFNIAGIQTSAAYIPNRSLRWKIWRQLNTDEVGEPNVFAVQAAVAAFNEGGEWLDELRQYIYENKLAVRAYLEKNIPQIKLVPSEATYLLWLDCTSLKMDSRELAKHIRKTTGLYLSNGAQYGGEGFLRMNIACPKTLLNDGLERLRKAVNCL